MIQDLILPDTGMGITEGTIVRWLKAVGDAVKKGEIVAEMETAKATVEVEAVCGGTIAEIVAGEGKTVDVGTVIARIEA
jgi:pyruvate/2-oxoglutarate dehydrogenase complex dihydrolipoamide acyltransferase (E2) component